ncbi:transcription factor A, mitochondrial [Octopus sinensis]|uniref:Transcription factor A, mitochondrial n=1 Tax=Octopus sinensis TaxID=2607531 RepID=A0A6P7TGG1_9MOLL|nr:transcription factor A, mitochondrial [Octopus sinensis]
MALKLITACSAFRSSTRLTFSCFSRPLARLSQDSNIDVPKPPKRPMSAFFEFASKNRPAILENNPGIDSQQVIRKVSEIYKNLPDSEKQVLREQAQVRLQAYKEQYAQFRAELSAEQLTALKESFSKKKENRAKRKKKLSERKHGRPRRPMNSYAIFVQASKVERGNLPFVDFSKQLANTWKNLPKEEKEIYNEEARLEREKYAIQMMNWEKLMLEEGRLDLIRGYRRPSKKVKKVTKAKKKKKIVVKAKKVKVRKSKRTKKKTKSTKAPKVVSKEQI